MKRLFSKVGRAILSPRPDSDDSFIFIHINKTGGSSIESALQIPLEHKTAQEKIHEIGETNWNKTFTFTVVRNPWDKVVSMYHWRVKRNHTELRDKPVEFNDWVRLTFSEKSTYYYDNPKMFMPQFEWISNRSGEIAVNKIMRFESLSSEFEELAHILGRRSTLPHVKKSDRGDYRKYYDEETAEIVADWFDKDVSQFGYQF